MKRNSLASLLVLTSMIFVSACGSNPIEESIKESEKNLSDMNTTYQSSGVKECDEVIALINKGLGSADEGYLARAARELFLNKAREEIAKQVQVEKDQAKLAKSCTDIKQSVESQLLGGQN